MGRPMDYEPEHFGLQVPLSDEFSSDDVQDWADNYPDPEDYE